MLRLDRVLATVIVLSILLVIPTVPNGVVTGARAPGPLQAPLPAATSAGPKATHPTVSAPTPSLSGSATWVNITTRSLGASPTARMYASEAYDPQLGGTILFGGLNNASRTSPTPAFNDTWLFANGTWTNLTARFPVTPIARWAASLTWDTADGYLLLFGGRSGGNATTLPRFLNDSWAFNGSGWKPILTANAPAPRGMAPIAFDPAINATLLFSGGDIDFANGTIAAFHDTWTYTGGVWTNITATAGTGAGQASSMAYDPDVGGVIATGIMRPGSICTSLNQTWVYANGTWTKLLNSSSPLPGGNLVYDGELHTLVYAGGCLPPTHVPLALTWEYSNGTWTNLTGSLPSLQGTVCCTALAYDATQKVVLLYGGDSLRPTPRLGYVNWAYTFPVGPLAVTLSANRLSGSVPCVVNLTSVRSGGEGPYTYAWAFHDGTANASTQNVTHTFTTPGVYVVTYTTVDSAGRSVNASLTLTAGPSFSVNASAVPTSGEAPLPVVFNATATGGFPPYHFAWDFGDGGTSSGANGTHLYQAGGTFTVALNGTDAEGDSARWSTTVTVVSAVSATVTRTPTVGVAPLLVEFAANTSGGVPPYAISWQFGDGSTSTGSTALHTYASPGFYVAVLNVTDSYNRTALVSTNVTVVAPLTAQASAGPTVGVAPLLVGFTGAASGGLAPFTYAWDFGDGGTGTGTVPSHTYGQVGNFSATLTVHDALNESSTSTVGIRVASPLTVAMPASIIGVVPLTVSLDPAVAGGVGPYTFAWSYGDGGTGTGTPVTHTYTQAGAFLAKATVTDALGDAATNSTSVLAVEPVRASVASSSDSIVLGSPVWFNVTPTGGYGLYVITWTALPPGCGAAASGNLSCTPSGTGTFHVTVNVADSLGDQTNASTNVTVTAAPSTGAGWLSGTTLLILGIVVVVVVIAILVLLLLRPRNRRPPVQPASPAETGEMPPAEEAAPES